MIIIVIIFYSIYNVINFEIDFSFEPFFDMAEIVSD